MGELVIIGGGPAGMSAALIAGRCRLAATIINAEQPRNGVTTASHGFLTRDGLHPLEMLEIGKEQLTKYPSVQYIADKVIAVAKDGDGFLVQRANGPDVRARRIIIATGCKDDLDSLNLPGLREVYGKSVYPCPFCDGFEHSNERIALFGADGVEHFAPLIKMWTDDLHVFTNGRTLGKEAADALTRNEVSVHEGHIEQLESKDGKLTAIRIDGEAIPRDAGFVFDDPTVTSNPLADALGIEKKKNDWGMMTYNADESGKTNVPGVYVVGDTRTGFSGLIAAASEGSACVEGIVHQISQERWQ